jgi:hypothetical protein
MVEPSRSDPVEHLSKFMRTAPPFVGLRVELTLPWLPLAELLPALLGQPSLEIARSLSTNLQDRVEFRCWAGLAHHQDQGVERCRAHHEESIKAYRPAGTRYRSNTEFLLVLRCAYW